MGFVAGSEETSLCAEGVVRWAAWKAYLSTSCDFALDFIQTSTGAACIMSKCIGRQYQARAEPQCAHGVFYTAC